MLTVEQIQEAEGLSGLFFIPEDILLIMGLPENTMQDKDFQRAYKRGRLISEAKIRKSIFEHAQNGSSPAQNMAVKIIEDSKLD
jgi:hypothetical protein